MQNIDKDKLYKFLREMEFNRLLSSAISAYGEPELKSNKIVTQNLEKQQTINNKNYYLISSLEEQLRFAVREGGRTVGSGVITKVIS